MCLNTVIFERLTEDALGKITQAYLDKVCQTLLDKNIRVSFDSSVVNMIVEKGKKDDCGARNIRRLVLTAVHNPLALRIAEGSLPEGTELTLCSDDLQKNFIKTF